MLTSDAQARFPDILQRLRQAYPNAHCALDYQTPIQLLVATILSAQCTDERVNKVTPALFARYPDAAALAHAPLADLETLIFTTGFYRQKALSIQTTARILLEKHGGQLPHKMADLLKLRGVARKTANVVLGEIYGQTEGIVVDTHVKRLANRLGLVREKEDPVKIEQELMGLVPRDAWIEISHLLIFHGRRICEARKPDCLHCPLRDLCPSAVG
ncbi:MAG: endonuclease III [Candidatus Promineifilaceae bacterium]